EDIRAGAGLAVVDPHGDLAEKVIQFIPSDRINDVIYFNPADMENPIAFNVVEHVDSHLRHLVASGLIGVFQKLWADSWGPRLEYILRNAILAVLDYPGSTLLAVTRMLSDKAFRKKVIEKIEDPVVKAFWVNEFASYNDKFASEAVSPIQNKVGQFLSSSLIRNIVGQVNSSLDMRKIMDEGKILILNLSKGRIGEDNSALLGAMMITKIQLAAMSRVDIVEKTRQDFYLYVDEFQNFTSDSFANILSEARKYRLNLILAHQYIEQLSETVKFAVFGNVGTLIVFRVGAADAEALAPEFTPTFTEEDIVNLPKFEIYLKLMIDGMASEPFSARGLAPLRDDEKTGNEDKVIKVSRERYSKKREIVEEKILRWHNLDDDEEIKPKPTSNFTPGKNPNFAPSQNANPGQKFNPTQNQNFAPNQNQNFNSPQGQNFPQRPNPNPIQNQDRAQNTFTPTREGTLYSQKNEERKAPSADIYKFSTQCARCGKETKTSFEPDGVRPIYCKDCLSAAKKEKSDELQRRLQAKQKELEKLDSREISQPKTPIKSFTPNQNSPLPPRRPTVINQRPIERTGFSPRVEEVKTISLQDALKMPPQQFKNNGQTKPSNNFNPVRKEKELKEDQEINFSN
ncbi:MAG: TraM recognition domain-containing protein, partial [Candidatus Magasanikbacteria bacterium]|nr:TraM recognition domain-containing protein [Candidatus Magasanikbacteria bacterium]